MQDHDDEEGRVKPRKGAPVGVLAHVALTTIARGGGLLEAAGDGPCNSKVDVTGVVNLPGESVPAVDEDCVALCRSQGFRVIDCLPRELRKCLAHDHLALFSLAEAVLLRVAGVPNPIDEAVADKHGSDGGFAPPVLVGVVVC